MIERHSLAQAELDAAMEQCLALEAAKLALNATLLRQAPPPPPPPRPSFRPSCPLQAIVSRALARGTAYSFHATCCSWRQEEAHRAVSDELEQSERRLAQARAATTPAERGRICCTLYALCWRALRPAHGLLIHPQHCAPHTSISRVMRFALRGGVLRESRTASCA